MALSNFGKGALAAVAVVAAVVVRYHLYESDIERSRQHLADKARGDDVASTAKSDATIRDDPAPAPVASSYVVSFTCIGPGGVSLQLLHCLTSGSDMPTGSIKIRQGGDVRVFGVNDFQSLSQIEIRQPLSPGFQIDAQNEGGDGTSLRMEILNRGARVYADAAGPFEVLTADEDTISS